MISKKWHQAVFFDVDDTMYDHLQPTRGALQHVMGLDDSFPYEAAYHRIRYYSDKLAAEGGLLHRAPGTSELEEMRIRRFILAMREFGSELSWEQAARLQAEYLDRQYRITPFIGAPELMKDLADAGVLVGLITNGPEEHQLQKIRALALESHVAPEHVFISGAVGYAKPDPRIFTAVNERTGTTADVCWYVGDSWRNDVVGASLAGWKVLWFNHRQTEPETTEHSPYGTAASYEELREMLLPT
ncbi:HAD family hydrolase [Paenibacillus enshidis]|uniref:HAD family hydrolase n=1 Tax=Paenibacillus enshidis TaxID=1458439 RepID=A0ABV5ARS3_9BACL